MILKIPDSWLREYLETEATPEEIKEFLTLSGPTVEAIKKLPDDTIYTVEVTPNRNDLFSIYGLAREANAILQRYGKKVNLKSLPTPKKLPTGRETPNVLPLKAEIKEKSLCPHFLAVVLNNIKVGSSPKFMRERLQRSGLREVNNVVDISNYVMLETGQPLHIFDYDKIEGNLMQLREARTGEEITTLDGVTRLLPRGSIVIEDGEKIIDLCGIMGGKNSEVSENTSSIVLFAQRYDPLRVRKTYRKLNLITEAALRFEKGLDPEMVRVAFLRALELLKSHTQARIAGDPIEIVNETFAPKEVRLSISQLHDYLGERISIKQASDYLRLLGFEVTVIENAFEPPKIKVKVPSFRDTDIEIPEDLIEEIARLHGYHNLPETLPSGPPALDSRDRIFHWEEVTKNILKYAGFFEVYNYSPISKELFLKTAFDLKAAIKIKNPLQTDIEYLRTSLLPSLLKNIADNLEYAEELRLFELERVYLKDESEKLPDEPFYLSGIVYKSLTKEKETGLFYEVKGILEAVIKELGITDYNFSAFTVHNKFWHPGRVAMIKIQSEPIGIMGEIHPKVLEGFSSLGKAVAFETNFATLAKAATDIKPFKPIPETATVIEDISLIVDKKIPVAEIRDKIREVILGFEPLDLKPSELYPFDIYENKALGKNKKSVTFRVLYRKQEGPISSGEVVPVRDAIFRYLEEALKAKIRR